MLKTICLITFCTVASVVAAQSAASEAAMKAAAKPPAPLQPGVYLGERGSGELNMKRDAAGRLSFSLESIGANAHVCSLEGRIQDGVAKLQEPGMEQACVVTFKTVPGGIHVTGDGNGGCRYFCGMRAGFDGEYLTPPAACAPSAFAATRRTFQEHYDQKRFADARATLEPLLKTCARFFDSNMDGRLRNDLAVTLHKLGELKRCRELLQPFAEDAALSDDEIRGGYPPSDAENYLAVLRAVRTNLKLCAEKKG